MADRHSGDPAEPLGSSGAFDLPAFERLFHEHVSPLTRFVYSYVKVWDVAEDIVHDVFMQLWLRQRKLEPVRDLAAYLYTIARYDALDYLRHAGVENRHRRAHVHDGETTFPPTAEHELLASEVTAALQRAVDSLPERQREVVLLRWERQASYQEIAAKLRISPKTVDAHLQRAFAQLRKILPRLLS